MRGSRAKALRADIKFERALEANVTDTGWVETKRGRIVLAPSSRRAMYKQLKKKVNLARRLPAHLSKDEFELALLTPAEAAARGLRAKTERRRSPKRRIPAKLLKAFPSVIEKPLMYILQHRLPLEERHPVTNQIISVTPHKDYAAARAAADRGDGSFVRAMARAICFAG